MALHHTLRDAVAARGAEITADPERLRAALGEIQGAGPDVEVLTEAVRTGAVRRLVDQLDQGTDPWTAVHGAGTALAQERGSTEVIRSCWAVAAIGFALGRVDQSVVESFDATAAGTREVPDTEPPASGGPQPRPTPQSAPQPTQPPQPPGMPTGPTPPAVKPPGGKPPLGLLLLIGAAAVLLVAALGTAGVVLVRNVGSGSDNAPDADSGATATGDDGAGNGSGDGPDGGDENTPPQLPPVPSNAVVVSFDVDGVSSLYQVDVETGEATQLTQGPADGLPSVSPTRSEVAYVSDTAARGKRVRVLDFATGETRRLFEDSSDCAFGNRPAYRPNGEQVALVCTDEHRTPRGLYLADLEGDVTPLVEASDLGGSPTWKDADTLIYNTIVGEIRSYFELDVSTPDAQPVPFDIDANGAAVTHIDWSIEEGALLYQRAPIVNGKPEEFGEIRVARPPQPAKLLDVPLRAGHPAWSPDGTSIVVVVEQDFERRLATFPLNDPQQVNTVPVTIDGELGIPAWGTR